jgi:succinate dehydrogenase flavin-adding protein (antitoxin of CptAB toxin-antitoxin module)
MPESTEALRKAIRFRCMHVGMLEVEELLKRWCDRRLHELEDA